MTKTQEKAIRFVMAWQRARSKAEAAKKVGLSISGASARATYYRRHNVPLKKFGCGGGYHKLDYTALAALCKSK